MNTKHAWTLSLVLLAGLSCSAAAQSTTQQRTTTPNDSSAAKAGPSDARVGTPTSALKVTVSAEGWSGEFVSYRSGENFVVIVPQAKASAITWNLVGQGLSALQVEQRGDDVVVLLRTTSDTKPIVRQDGNRYEILFAGTNTKAAERITSAAERAPSTGNDPAGRMTSNGSDPIPPPIQPAAAPSAATSTSAAPAVQDFQGLVRSFLQRNTTADALNLDLLVPESAAFAVLGFTPQTVLRPATPQQFATSLINGLDQNGNFQNGLALETAPYMLFNGENVTIRDYMEQYLTRVLSRTQFSFAVTKGSSNDDLSTRLAAGINFVLWDRGDPRVYRPGQEGDVLDCFVKNLDSSIPIPPTIDPDDVDAVRNFVAPELARLKPIADKCRSDGQKARWNRSAWTVAYAPSWIMKDGPNSDIKWNGGAFWTSVAYGFEEVPSLRKIGQLIVHLRNRSREEVPDDANPGQFLIENTWFLGARFRAGSPKLALNIEDAYLRSKGLTGRVDTSNRFTIGGELRLNDNLYFVISAGRNSGRVTGENNGFVMSSFKYGFNRKPQLTPQP